MPSSFLTPPLLRDLPRPSRALLFRRLRTAGIRVRRAFNSPPWPTSPFFSLSGCWFRRGTLHWDSRTDVDTFAHEACHALGLTPAQRLTWDQPEIPTHEGPTMVLQVELLRGIPELGVGRALAYMEGIGYSFDVEEEAASAVQWWRRQGRGAVQRPLPWQEEAHA